MTSTISEPTLERYSLALLHAVADGWQPVAFAGQAVETKDLANGSTTHGALFVARLEKADVVELVDAQCGSGINFDFPHFVHPPL